MRFGEFAVSKGSITREQLQKTLMVSKYSSKLFGRLLKDLGYLTESSLDSLLIQFLKPDCSESFSQLKAMRDKVELTTRKNFDSPNECLVVQNNKQRIFFAVIEFSDYLHERLEKKAGKSVELWKIKPTIFKLLQGDQKNNDKHTIVLSGDLSCDQKIREENPFTKMLRQCFEEACRLKASDIHFEPFENRYLIRFRVHGALNDWKTISEEHKEPITNKLKWILNLDLAIASKPQDSRASFDSLSVDMRINSMPTSCGGEKIVVRIQYQDERLGLKDIGFDDEKIKVLKRNISKSNGLVIISGPTGSGKTTTLYALLEEMDRLGKNISTLENPVEKKLERITQSSVANGEDFHDFQKALMRQDPDIILLGEIRDPESADLSMKLASTGHLVLSTVHANGAKEVVDRLLNLGIDDFTIKTNLRLSVAQRLVKKLCSKCKISVNDRHFKTNTTGCASCSHGITGRMAIIEYLERDDLCTNSLPTSLKLECQSLVDKGLIDVSNIETYA